jgi:hypothetical protein
MRVGQKNKLAYRWARKGSRPRATHDKRTQSTYLFGAVCPELGTGAALVLPACNTEAMQLHLDEIAKRLPAPMHFSSSIRPAGTARRTSGPQQPFDPTAATACTGTQRSGKRLAVHAAELALQPHLQILRRYRRSLLLCLEYPHRPALENHVSRSPRLGNRRSGIVRIGITRQATSRGALDTHRAGRRASSRRFARIKSSIFVFPTSAPVESG